MTVKVPDVPLRAASDRVGTSPIKVIYEDSDRIANAALSAAMNPALGDQRLVPYGQARAEVLGEAVEVLQRRARISSSLLEIDALDRAVNLLIRHFDLHKIESL